MHDVVIIGAGPAGFTAALYTARAGLKTALFGITKNSNAYKAHLIENYFGLESISGPDLMARGLAQAQRFGTEFVEREILDMKIAEDGTFEVRDSELVDYKSKALIIASGLGFKPSGIRNEQKFLGKGVSFCVTCDGFFFKGKSVALLGSTNYAGEEALQMLSYTPHVTVLSHGKEFSFTPAVRTALEERGVFLQETPRITTFDGGDSLEKLIFADGSERSFDGVFMALGVASAGDFATKLGLERTGPQNAFIVADPRTGETAIPGIYAAGDCTGGNAQASKSSGEGCNAAMSVIKFVKGVAAYVDYA
ncbi:NAD(P)/FAD-dependent oxidoreductase [Candidatus Peregrinibacteria bacterium CG_4_9_14_0_2_um_filter_53_11]|nr:MAG: NAD(P)/FAD-dependent oxidoreductase [Candidatus Peregrinibacteria bacterium CG_4_9_14_0_2_um_filter_53_11]